MSIHFEGTFNTDLWLIEIQAIKATFDNGTNRPLLKKGRVCTHVYHTHITECHINCAAGTEFATTILAIGGSFYKLKHTLEI